MLIALIDGFCSLFLLLLGVGAHVDQKEEARDVKERPIPSSTAASSQALSAASTCQHTAVEDKEVAVVAVVRSMVANKLN